MDLFGDLPEPASTNGGSVGTKTNEKLPDVSSQLPTPLLLKRTHSDSLDDVELHAKMKKLLPEGLFSLKGYCCERQGERDEMQDAHVIIDPFTNVLSASMHESAGCILRASYYGVFDGHGGARASAHAAHHLHANIAAKFPKGNLETVEKDIKKCLVDAYKKTDEDFLKLATKTKPSWKDGTTATTVLALNNTLYIANIGDSRAVLCRQNGSGPSPVLIPVVLTKDHSPTEYSERMRIQKAGGTVRDGRVLGQLEVSRSIGDGQYKTHGVVSLPDVKRCALTENDRFLIIACDGLWKAFTNDEAITFVNTQLQHFSDEIVEGKTLHDCRYEHACSRIVTEALRKLSGDNVTVLIVAIGAAESAK